MYDLTLDPPAVATAGRLELDLSADPIRGESRGIDWGDAAVTQFMSNEQRWGAAAIDFRVPNRIVTIPLGVGTDDAGTGFDPAFDALRQKVALFQREGGWIKRDSGRGFPLY